MVWWNPDARGPDEAGKQGAGMYEYVEGGRRYLPGEWPTEPLLLFDPDHAVAIYDRPPGAADLPRYEPPTQRPSEPPPPARRSDG